MLKRTRPAMLADCESIWHQMKSDSRNFPEMKNVWLGLPKDGRLTNADGVLMSKGATYYRLRQMEAYGMIMRLGYNVYQCRPKSEWRLPAAKPVAVVK